MAVRELALLVAALALAAAATRATCADRDPHSAAPHTDCSAQTSRLLDQSDGRAATATLVTAATAANATEGAESSRGRRGRADGDQRQLPDAEDELLDEEDEKNDDDDDDGGGGKHDGGGGHQKKKKKGSKKKKKKHHHGGFFSLMKKMKKHLPAAMHKMHGPSMFMMGMAHANFHNFVMHALMMSKMALTTVVMMIVREMVFGDKDQPVKYYNFGYDHHRRRRIHHESPYDYKRRRKRRVPS